MKTLTSYSNTHVLCIEEKSFYCTIQASQQKKSEKIFLGKKKFCMTKMYFERENILYVKSKLAMIVVAVMVLEK